VIADLLLLNSVVGVSTDLNNSQRSQCSHMASFAVCVAAMYLASVVDKVTVRATADDLVKI